MVVVSRVPLIHSVYTLMWLFGSSHIRVTRPRHVDLHRSASEKGIVSVHGSGASRYGIPKQTVRGVWQQTRDSLTTVSDTCTTQLWQGFLLSQNAKGIAALAVVSHQFRATQAEPLGQLTGRHQFPVKSQALFEVDNFALLAGQIAAQ